jgi:hypothetical protein
VALTRIQDIVLDSVSRPVPGASVAVLTQPANTSAQPGSPLALLFLDSAGLNPAPNPVITDGLGNYDFYVAPGVYTIQIFGNKIPQQIVIPDVQASLLVTSSTGTTGQFVTGMDSNGNLIYGTPANTSVTIATNAQTGTTYTVANGDQGKLVTLNNSSSVAVTLPQAGTSSQFLSGWFAYLENIGTGVVTITPTTSTIDGASTFVLAQNTSALIVSDGTNYRTVRGLGSQHNVSNANVTPVTVTSTTSQTALQAVTTLTGELNQVGRWVSVMPRGFFSTGATGGTLAYTLKAGSTTLATFSFSPGNSTANSGFYFDIDIMTQTAGSTGALEVQARGTLQNVAGSVITSTTTVTGIDLTQAITLTLFSTASQTTTSTTSRMMGYRRNN